ncbi:hypothetical protein EMQ25_00965 [Arsenicitalea aurantiaca]|uniref:DUF2946 domain-containing protein n=1 Tax=Arsenicitalea aurantiaca TaxID=1783274 RepID=A0A433XKG0_9HYPH|nr:hypothetical protein [Arsenicitalea aurantiaca]RUT34567.1 hypothetical protein EMQ25_00965 [Arsenicitalea aurantiaca]
MAPLARKSVAREIGTAFAVLAVYLLTLLVPLHQAAASQRDFAALGYETIGAWSVCTAINEAGSEDQTPTAVNCPVTAVGKFQLALVDPVPQQVFVPVVSLAVYFTPDTRAPPPAALFHTIEPRAPPVAV